MPIRSRLHRLAVVCGLLAAVLACVPLAGLGTATPVEPAVTAPDPAAAQDTTPTSPVPSGSPAPSVPPAPLPTDPPVPPPVPIPTPSAIPTPSPTASPEQPEQPKQARGGRVAVGDSLMVGAAAAMRASGFTVDGQVGRQFGAAPSILRSFGSSLKRNVVVELGTNGAVSLSTCREVVRIAGAHRRVFLVNNRVPRSWQDSNNRTLRRCDRSFRASRVRIVDWHGASAGRPSWFIGDRIHTSASGRVAFAKLIDRTVDRHGL